MPRGAATRRGDGVSGFGRNAGERYVLFKKFMPFAWGDGGALLTPDGTAQRVRLAGQRRGARRSTWRLAEARPHRAAGADRPGVQAGQGRRRRSRARGCCKTPKQAPGPRLRRVAHAAAGDRSRALGLVRRRRAAGVVRARRRTEAAAWRLAKFLASREASLAVARREAERAAGRGGRRSTIRSTPSTRTSACSSSSSRPPSRRRITRSGSTSRRRSRTRSRRRSTARRPPPRRSRRRARRSTPWRRRLRRP